MKDLLTKMVKKIKGRKYIHIAKKDWTKKLVKKCLNVERIRGRGRNWKTIGEEEARLYLEYPNYKLGSFTRALGYDGHVPLKYASYLYVKLR